MSETSQAKRSVAASADRRALVAPFAGASGIAFAPIFVRLGELAPTATAFDCFALAVPVLWVWLALGDTVGRSESRPRRRHPSSATDYAILALAEPLGPVQALGAAVVLAGIWIARRGSVRS